MLSKRFYQIFDIFSKIGVKFGSWLFTYDYKNQQFISSGNMKKLRRNYSASVFWALASFVLIIKHYLMRDTERFIKTLLLWIGGITAMNCLSLIRWYPHDHIIFLNGFSQYLRNFQEMYAPKFNPETNRMNVVIDTWIFLNFTLWNTIALLVSCVCLYDTHELIFLGGLIPDNYYSYMFMGFPIAIFHIYQMSYLVLNIALSISFFIGYISYVKFIVTKEFSYGLKTYKTLDILRTPEHTITSYRAFQILHANLLCFTGQFIALFHSAVTVFCTYGGSVLLAYWVTMDFMLKAAFLTLTVGSLIVWTLILETGKLLFINGNRMLNSWKRFDYSDKHDAAIMRKFLRSCTPITLCYGNAFVVRRVTPFMFVKGVLRGIFRLSLTIHRKIK